MSLESVLASGRAAAEARMTDACNVARITLTNTGNGAVTETATPIHSGPCRLRQPASGSSSASRVEVGEASLLLQQPEVHLPISAPLLRPGDRITMTASATDPAAVGRVFLVRAVPGHSQATARRYGVTERTS